MCVVHRSTHTQSAKESHTNVTLRSPMTVCAHRDRTIQNASACETHSIVVCAKTSPAEMGQHLYIRVRMCVSTLHRQHASLTAYAQSHASLHTLHLQVIPSVAAN